MLFCILCPLACVHVTCLAHSILDPWEMKMSMNRAMEHYIIKENITLLMHSTLSAKTRVRLADLRLVETYKPRCNVEA